MAAQRSFFLLLDIDNTLYEYADSGFGKEMHDLIFEYAEKKLNLSNADAEALSIKYYQNYGLSLRGYVEHFNIDAKDYSDYVHRCSYERLSYNAPLVDMLTRLHYGPEGAGEAASATKATGEHEGSVSDGTPTQRIRVHGQHEKVQHHLYYFTNANRPHARRVLTPLGLRPLFTRPRQAGSPTTASHKQYDAEGFEESVEWLGFSYEDQWRLTGALKANKPMKEAYEAIFKAIDEEIALDERQQQRDGNDGSASPVKCSELSNHKTANAGDGQSLSPTTEFTAHKRAHLQPRNMVMVDDSLMNLDAPLELGWSVVWYAHDNQQLPAMVSDNSEADNSADGKAKERTMMSQSSKRALYEEAITSGRMKVIHHILELEKAVEELARIA